MIVHSVLAHESEHFISLKYEHVNIKILRLMAKLFNNHSLLGGVGLTTWILIKKREKIKYRIRKDAST